MKEFMRSRDYASDRLVLLVVDLIKVYDQIIEDRRTNNLINIPEVNPHCSCCKGSGVVLYNFWGEAKFKDDEEYLDQEVREEPCPKCEGAKLA
jgi:hypothetical protein